MPPVKNRFAPIAAVLAGLVWMVPGVLRLAYPGQTDSGSSVEGWVGHVLLTAMSVGLLLLIPALLELARSAERDTGAKVAVVGMVGLAILATISNVRGEDPSFFPPVAIVTNLLWFGGMVALAVSLKRAGRISPKLAILLPITWFLSLPLAIVGGTVLAGAYWVNIGRLMHQATPRAQSAPAAVTA